MFLMGLLSRARMLASAGGGIIVDLWTDGTDAWEDESGNDWTIV